MTTKVDNGLSIDFTAAAAIASGAPVLLGAIVGLAVTSYNIGDSATAWLTGKHLVNKNVAEAWTLGAKLYWDNTNLVFTVTVGSNTFAGYAATAQANGDTTGEIILRQ